MKLSILATAMVALLLVCSCSTEEQTTQTTVDLNLESVLEEIKTASIASEEAVEFTIGIRSSGDVDLGEARPLSKERTLQDMTLDFDAMRIDVFNIEQGQQRIQVCCNNGDTTECVDCKQDNLCILAAVRDCVDDGGCSEVCRSVIRYIPGLNTYYVVKE